MLLGGPLASTLHGGNDFDRFAARFGVFGCGKKSFCFARWNNMISMRTGDTILSTPRVRACGSADGWMDVESDSFIYFNPLCGVHIVLLADCASTVRTESAGANTPNEVAIILELCIFRTAFATQSTCFSRSCARGPLKGICGPYRNIYIFECVSLARMYKLVWIWSLPHILSRPQSFSHSN